MTDMTKKVLIVFLGLAILFLAYMYVFSPAKEDVDSLKTQCDELQVRLDDLIQKEAQKQTLLDEIDQYDQEFQEILKDFPADLNQEVAVMFLKSVEENNEFVNRTFSLPVEAEFYRLGQSAAQNGDVVVDDALTGQQTVKEQYICTTASYGITYSGSYEGVKSLMAYIAGYKYRMNIPQFTMTYEEQTDSYTGSLSINAYAISGPDRTPDTVDPGLPTGTDNLFFAGDGSGGATTRPSKYDADQGETIKTNNNLVIMLNSANSDVAAGIIVSSNAAKDETYVTSNDNAVVDVNLSVYSDGGKNYVEYSIGDQKYTAEILSTDLAVYVKSSARVDSSDANGVRVSVTNTTTLPVYFKVSDDDTTSPRFSMGTKSGQIRVY